MNVLQRIIMNVLQRRINECFTKKNKTKNVLRRRIITLNVLRRRIKQKMFYKEE